MRVIAAFIALSLGVLGSSSAQSLADVARKESERRQTTATGKSYSNQDLRPVREVTPVADPADASTASSAPADAASSADKPDAAAADSKSADSDETKSDVKDEAYWSKRMTELRDRLDRDQTFLQALQGRVDALTSDFVNRDDPAQRGQIAGDRQKTLAELERLRKSIEADKKAIPDLEEEARHSGVPAGWLR